MRSFFPKSCFFCSFMILRNVYGIFTPLYLMSLIVILFLNSCYHWSNRFNDKTHKNNVPIRSDGWIWIVSLISNRISINWKSHFFHEFSICITKQIIIQAFLAANRMCINQNHALERVFCCCCYFHLYVKFLNIPRPVQITPFLKKNYASILCELSISETAFVIVFFSPMIGKTNRLQIFDNFFCNKFFIFYRRFGNDETTDIIETNVYNICSHDFFYFSCSHEELQLINHYLPFHTRFTSFCFFFINQ